MQTNTSESLPRTIPELLENHTIQVQPQGYSMYPLFVPGRDSAVIEKADCDRLKKGDVILYRRENGILVLHRICRITKDGFYTVGDNQTAVEGPLTASQISGKLIHIIRNGHSFSVNHPVYRILCRILAVSAPGSPSHLSADCKVEKYCKYIFDKVLEKS